MYGGLPQSSMQTPKPPPSTINPHPSTLNPQPFTLKTQNSTHNPQPSTLKPSSLNPQHSTLITQSPTLQVIEKSETHPSNLYTGLEIVNVLLDRKLVPPHPTPPRGNIVEKAPFISHARWKHSGFILAAPPVACVPFSLGS